jgi:hypothetical protein
VRTGLVWSIAIAGGSLDRVDLRACPCGRGTGARTARRSRRSAAGPRRRACRTRATTLPDPTRRSRPSARRRDRQRKVLEIVLRAPRMTIASAMGDSCFTNGGCLEEQGFYPSGELFTTAIDFAQWTSPGDKSRARDAARKMRSRSRRWRTARGSCSSPTGSAVFPRATLRAGKRPRVRARGSRAFRRKARPGARLDAPMRFEKPTAHLQRLQSGAPELAGNVDHDRRAVHERRQRHAHSAWATAT